jgi:endoglucanase
MRALRLPISLLLLALAAALLAAPAGAWDSTQPTSSDNPLANQKWFVDWEWGMSQRQVAIYRRRGEHAKEALMMKLARNPQTKRFGKWVSDPGTEVRRYLGRMEEADPGALAFLYVYRLPHDGCAAKKRGSWMGPQDPNYNAGGAKEAAAYRRWIEAFAAGLGDHRTAVFLEPDGIGTMNCLHARDKAVRYGLFRYAIDQLSQHPNTTIYLDAGAPDWMPVSTAVSRLRKAGVARVRGFFLNSTHYAWTSDNIRYGDKIARRLGGKHYVVSTAVNGRGPFHLKRAKRYFNEQRCNPPGRALGPEPTVRTASVFADAYVWIGDPGRSGGRCHGGTPAGTWWPEYALGLAKGAQGQ